MYLGLFILFILLSAVLITSYVSFRMAFYTSRKNDEKLSMIPETDEYTPFKENFKVWRQQLKDLPHEELTVRSFDGLVLKGNYYESKKGAPIELMLHGYRSSPKRDLCGGVNRAYSIGHNVLLVSQRACGDSEGHVITFGINESYDVLSWLELLQNKFGKDVTVILTGISMGAATALMSIERGLPPCVKGILADCGYSSPKKIIKKVIREMKLPPNLMYPFVRLGAKLFGRFDPDEITPVEAVKKSPVPIVFAHGDKDSFVPYYMSVENFNACTSDKKLITIKGAGHGLCYPYSPDEYVKELDDFFNYLK